MRGVVSGALLAAMLIPATAHAADVETMAILGLEADDGAPDSVAQAITTALRQRVTPALGFRLVPGRDLVELKLIFSCPDEAPSCMVQVAESLGAAKVVFGSVKKAAGDAYLVTLKLLDAKKGKIDAYVAEQLTRAQASGPALRGPAQKWLSDLTGRATTGTIRVSSNVTGASIVVDGLPVGVTTESPIELPGISAGQHEVVVTKPGHEPITNAIEIKAGKVQELDVTLTANAAPSGDGDETARVAGSASSADVSSGQGVKLAAWSTAGLGVLSVVMAIKFGIDVQSTNDKLDPYRRFDCDGGPANACDISGEEVGPLDSTDIGEVKDIKDDGSRAETLQYVFYGLSAALLGTSAYLFYSAYFSDDASSSAGGRRQLARRPNLLVAPSFDGRGGAGFQARLSF